MSADPRMDWIDYQPSPEALHAAARERIARQNARRLDDIGLHVAGLLAVLEQLDVATVPADQRAGLKTALSRLSKLANLRASDLLRLTLSSTPASAGSTAVPRTESGQP